MTFQFELEEIRTLGFALMDWHSGQWSPIYKIACNLTDGVILQDSDLWTECMSELESALNWNKQTNENKADLEILISELESIRYRENESC